MLLCAGCVTSATPPHAAQVRTLSPVPEIVVDGVPISITGVERRGRDVWLRVHAEADVAVASLALVPCRELASPLARTLPAGATWLRFVDCFPAPDPGVQAARPILRLELNDGDSLTALELANPITNAPAWSAPRVVSVTTLELGVGMMADDDHSASLTRLTVGLLRAQRGWLDLGLHMHLGAGHEELALAGGLAELPAIYAPFSLGGLGLNAGVNFEAVNVPARVALMLDWQKVTRHPSDEQTQSLWAGLRLEAFASMRRGRDPYDADALTVRPGFYVEFGARPLSFSARDEAFSYQFVAGLMMRMQN